MYTDNIHIDPARLKQLARERNRTLLRIRFIEGIKQLALRPFKIIPIAALTALFIFIFLNQKKITTLEIVAPTILRPVYGYIITTFLITFFLLLFMGLIKFIGTPSRSRSKENILMVAFTATDLKYAFCPILISNKKVNGSDVTIYEFFSKGISKSQWEFRQEEIKDAMNVHFVEPIQYGGKNKNNRNRIVLYCAPGANPIKRGKLYDDQL